MRYLKLMLFLLLLTTGVVPSALIAQSTTSLVIAVPDWWEGQLDDALFDEFEARYNHVEVVVTFVTSDEAFYTHPQVSIQDHINRALAYASKGDVIYTGTHQLYVETTRAGAFLDLTPLIATDTDLDTDDFYPAMWQSFQWDGGVWAIPLGGSLVMNVYDQTAFDRANVPYPDANWTIADYATYARELTTYKDSGSVDIPGFNSYYVPTLFYSLLNRGIYDTSTMPERANLLDEDLIEILSTWTALLDENVANPFGTVDFDSAAVPLHVEQTWRVTNRYMLEDSEWKATLLPNNQAGLQVSGFSISSGTTHPELAYDLIMYLTEQPDIVNLYAFDMLARQSMADVANENMAVVFGERPPELEALLNQAIQNAIPISEMRYYHYLDDAIQQIQYENKSVEDALLAAQQKLDENLAIAAEFGAEANVIVDVPLATPALAEGEISLNFGMNTLVSPLPNRDQWDRVAQAFAAADAEVGLVDLNFSMGVTEGYDCFYRQYNNLRSLSIEAILPIEPFLNADVTFSRDDISPLVLEQLTADSQIWGMPMNITPSILWINERMFNEAGVPIPQTQWTVADFIDALNQLDTITEDAPFSRRAYGGNYMLNLVAALGGLPIDPHQPEVAPDLTSEQTIGAIRQALDLAKAGLLDYETLGDPGYGSRGGIGVENVPIYDATLSSIDFRFQQRRDGIRDNFHPVLFPTGTSYAPLTLEVGASYINAGTPYAEACYRWIAHLAQHPELFDGMPARRSQLETTRTQGDDLYNLYTVIDSQMNQPDAIVFPFTVAGPSAFHYQQWMFRAFDAYVLDDVPLDVALTEAQQFIDAYARCVEPIEPMATGGLSLQERNAYVAQFTRCAAAVDPVFAEMYDTTS